MKFKQKVNNEGSEGASSSYPQGANLSGNIFKSGRWTRSEHLRFLQALKIYGKEWRKVQSHVKTRNSTQARSHAQKFFVKLEKKGLSFQEFIDQLNISDQIQDFAFDSDCASDPEDNDKPLTSRDESISIIDPPTINDEVSLQLSLPKKSFSIKKKDICSLNEMSLNTATNLKNEAKKTKSVLQLKRCEKPTKSKDGSLDSDLSSIPSVGKKRKLTDMSFTEEEFRELNNLDKETQNQTKPSKSNQ